MNNEVINERLGEMEENLDLLSELKDVEQYTFQNDPKIYKLAERCLEVSISCLIDVCHYIIAAQQWPRPKNNAEAILIVGEKGVIPNEFANSIVGMANLRNILVHSYLKIDRNILYNHIQKLDDFHTFQKHILSYLTRR
jgi:uncharacterized protein YutE (UPF0331/DUF86 family)